MNKSTGQARTEEKRLDRRISRTQGALRSAFLKLIEEKEYDSITVEEITERANLGRSTFYLHYRDKDELLLSYFSEVAQDRLEQLSQISLSIWRQSGAADRLPDSAARPILTIFEHAANNARLYRIVLKGDGVERVAGLLRRSITQAMDELLRVKLDQEGLKPQISVDLLAHYLVGAFLASLGWWLEQDMPCPAEEIARMFRLMLFPGLQDALGMEATQ